MWLIIALCIPCFAAILSLFMSKEKNRLSFIISQAFTFLLFVVISWMGFQIWAGKATSGRDNLQKIIHQLLIRQYGEGEGVKEMERAVFKGKWWKKRPLSGHPQEIEIKRTLKQLGMLESWELLSKNSQEIRELMMAYALPRIQSYYFLLWKPWIPDFNIHLFLGIHGYSFLLLWCFVLLFLLIPFFHNKSKWSYRNLLFKHLLEFSVVGLLASLHLFFFFFFWILLATLFYFIFLLESPSQKIRKGLSFWIHHSLSSFFMLIAILYLNYHSGYNLYSFPSLLVLSSHTSLISPLFLFLFALPFLVRMGFFPFHTAGTGFFTGLPSFWQAFYVAIFLNTGLFGWGQVWLPLYHTLSHNLSFIYVLLGWGLFQSLYFSFMQMALGSLRIQIGFMILPFMGFAFIGGILPFESTQMTHFWISFLLLFIFTPLAWGAACFQEEWGLNKFKTFPSFLFRKQNLTRLYPLFFLAVLGIPGTPGFLFFASFFSFLSLEKSFWGSLGGIFTLPYLGSEISLIYFGFVSCLFLAYLFLVLGTLQVMSRFYTSRSASKKKILSAGLENSEKGEIALQKPPYPISRIGLLFFAFCMLMTGIFPHWTLWWFHL